MCANIFNYFNGNGFIAFDCFLRERENRKYDFQFWSLVVSICTAPLWLEGVQYSVKKENGKDDRCDVDDHGCTYDDNGKVDN